MNYTENALQGVNRFKPSGKKILVFPNKAAEKTTSGIYIPDTAKERPQMGRVAKIAEGVTKYQEGDLVLYGKFAGIQMDFQENGDQAIVEYWLMDEDEIFGTYEDK